MPKILEELLGKIVEICKTPYGHFTILKAITYCTSAEDQKKVATALKGDCKLKFNRLFWNATTAYYRANHFHLLVFMYRCFGTILHRPLCGFGNERDRSSRSRVHHAVVCCKALQTAQSGVLWQGG